MSLGLYLIFAVLFTVFLWTKPCMLFFAAYMTVFLALLFVYICIQGYSNNRRVDAMIKNSGRF